MAFQPELNRRRRNLASTRPKTVRMALVAGAALAVVAGLAALVPALPVHADPGSARRELAQSLHYFERGNYTAARDHARAATREDPSWGLAHATLARFMLELGNGAAAEAEIDRAKETGFDPKRAFQLYAHAYELQGDYGRAADYARATPAPYRVYAARVLARAMLAQGRTAAAWRQLSVLGERTPGNSRVWSDLGRVHQYSGDLIAAAEATERALALDPANVDALVLRGQLIRAQYGLVGALPWFEAALKRDPRNHGALIEYAATLGEAGRYEDMLSAARTAADVKPEDPAAYYLQAVLAARAGQDELARNLMNRTGGKLANLPGALLLGGALDYSAGAWQQAIAQWGNLVGMQPKNIVARRLLAAALLRAGQSKGALELLKPVALRADADSYTLSLVGRAFEQRGQRDWAARFLDRAQAPARADATPFGSDESLALLGEAVAASNAPDVSIEYVRALLAADRTDQALTRAQQLVQANPGAPAAWLVLGDVRAAEQDWPGAIAAYRTAADRRFDEPTALRLVDAQDKRGDRSAAANTLALFLSQNPTNVAAQRLTAHWQVADGDWDSAIDTLERLRGQVGNRDAAVLAELGYAFVGKGDFAGGEAYAAAAYRLAPLNPAAADAWGWALQNLGDHEKAGQLLEKAVSLAPTLPGLRWHLAQVYWSLGDKARAAAQAKVALLDRTFRDRAAAARIARGQG